MNIAKFLNEKKMTQQDLGDSIGTSNQNVNRWVTGKGVPSYEFCQKLLELGMSVEDLFDIPYNVMHNLEYKISDEEKIQVDEFKTRVFSAIEEYMANNGAAIKAITKPIEDVKKPLDDIVKPFKQINGIVQGVKDKIEKNEAK